MCQSVKYEITGDIGGAIHCHCKTCQKAHSTAFSSVAMVMDENFKVTKSQGLKSYESSVGKSRYFCSNCGSQIYAKKINTPHIVLRLGSLDSDLKLKEQKHIWYSHKVSWFDLDSKIERCKEFE